ncbi:MAG: DUF192 domain-containing protein [Gaiella sp.]|nr:DUF192 domain-containing protein [Gaiella sp.]
MRKVPNLTLRREDGRVVAESVTVADSTGRRLRGLLGKKDLPSGHGVLLRPAWSIHTAFMRFPIDVVFLDADQIVVKVVPSLQPFHTASCRGAREVVELRAGECERRGLALGDRVAWAARAADEGEPVAVQLEGDRRGAVVLASSDQRYLKLVRFLLDGKGIDVVASVPPQRAAEVAGGESADVVLIDVGAVTEGCASRASRARGGQRRRSCSSARTRAATRRRGCGCTRSGTTRTAWSPRSRTPSSGGPCSLRVRAGVVAETLNEGSGHEMTRGEPDVRQAP